MTFSNQSVVGHLYEIALVWVGSGYWFVTWQTAFALDLGRFRAFVGSLFRRMD